MSPLQQFTFVEFHRFKAFRQFTFKIRHFNILVGPNNAGKSTILAAFRILAAALRKANRLKADIVQGSLGPTRGYNVDLQTISVAEENIFHNYNESEPAYIKFGLSNGNQLVLRFPERNSCQLILSTKSGKQVDRPAMVRSQFNCPIGFVPILGPVEHNELLYQAEAARLALFNYRAARNFRNIWHHFPEKFDRFRATLKQTWPGMDVEPPEIDLSYEKPVLHMFCPEGRIPREIFWAGFGFQVWCQMLTHLVQSDSNTIFLIDEPDIYLHSELQRQLLALLRTLGPDIILATHSTEIITEAEPDEIVLIDKKERAARRIKRPTQLVEVFTLLGSNLNPVLTQLAKTRRAVFVEGADFQIIGRFAQKCGISRVANRSDFAVIPAEGFNPQRVRSLKDGMEFTLGMNILAAVIFDRDYRSTAEKVHIAAECSKFCKTVTIYDEKELENFLLVPAAIDRAAVKRLADRSKRTGEDAKYTPLAAGILEQFATEKKSYVMAQFVTKREQFEKLRSPGLDKASVSESAIREFEACWSMANMRLSMIPGKEALSALNQELQTRHSVMVGPLAIIDAMTPDEISPEMKRLVIGLEKFSAAPVS